MVNTSVSLGTTGAAARVLSLSAVKSKDIYDHNYSIMIGAVGDFISVLYLNVVSSIMSMTQ
jgi:hypothetical protein